MVDSYTQKEIEKISMDVLKQAKAINVFPTPVDKIVQFCELNYETGINLANVDKSFFSKASFAISDNFFHALKQVRGFLDRSDKTIYLDLTQIVSRQNFVKLHETGHQVLPWQREIMEHLDNDDTLSIDSNEEFEAEANYFASITLFQHDRFISEMEKLELSLKAGMALGKKFGASNHAALRRMVEQSNKRCALLVLNTYSGIISDGMQCSKRNLFQSKKFTDEFGELNIPQQLGYEWTFTQDYISGRRFHESGEVILNTSSGETKFRYHYFNNTYNGFFFIMPQGELNKSRTKIVVSNF